LHVGLVLDVKGDWVLFNNGQTIGKVERGQGIPQGSTVRPEPPGSGWVVIHLNNDDVIRCEAGNLGRCRRPLVSGKSSSSGRFWAAIVNIVLGRGVIFEETLVRAPKGKGPQEAVMRLDGGQVDLSPAFQQAPPGRYHLLFTHVERDAPRESFAPVTLNWKPGIPSKVSVRGLSPGLYRLLLLDETKGDEPSGVEAWVLISDAERFPESATAFREAVTWSEKWNARGSRDAQSIFQRAYLNYLAQPSHK
jgi:hypothetical protein